MGDRSVLLPYARQATVPSLTGHCQLTCLLGLKRVAYTCSKLDKVPSIDDRRQTDRLTILANHNPYPSPWPMTILNFLRTMIMTNAHAKIKVKGRSVQKINCKQTDGVPTDGQTRQIWYTRSIATLDCKCVKHYVHLPVQLRRRWPTKCWNLAIL